MNQETSATAELDMNKLEGFRKKFPVLKDRD
jgi:predicted amidohydrolase